MIFRSIFVFFSLLVASESSNYWSDDHGEPKKHVIEEVGSANNIRRTNISTEVRKKTFDHYRMLQVDIDTILDSFGQVQEYIDMILDSFGQVQEYIDTILDLISQGREGVIDFLTSVGIFEDDGEIDQVILFTSVTCLTVITSPIWVSSHTDVRISFVYDLNNFHHLIVLLLLYVRQKGLACFPSLAICNLWIAF